MTDDQQNALILDVGSSVLKIGFSKEEEVRMTLPTRFSHVNDKCEFGTQFDSHLLLRGKVLSQDAHEAMFQKVFFEELKIAPSDYPLLMNQPNEYDFEFKRLNCSLFFEKFNIQHFFMVSEPLLNLYSNAKINGTVINIGHSFTTIDTLAEGQIIPYASKRQAYAGHDLTSLLAEKLMISYQEAELIKHDQLRFSKEFQNERHNILHPGAKIPLKEQIIKPGLNTFEVKKAFDLPDGRSLDLSSHTIDVAQSLYDNTIFGQTQLPLQYLLYENMIEIEGELRREMIQNVILAGGGTLIHDFRSTFKKQVEQMIPIILKMHCTSLPRPEYSQWKGGYVLANLGLFQSMWISKREYEESGLSVMERKRI